MGKKKKYIPNRKHNPIVIANKIETLTYKLDALDKTINALSKSHDNHISYLGNFARHDIKNAILELGLINGLEENFEMDAYGDNNRSYLIYQLINNNFVPQYK